MRRTLHAVVAIAAGIAAGATVRAEDAAAHSLWQIEGARNQIFLLGSVHFLRGSDYPLPAVFDTAYGLADVLYMEIDMDDLDPLAATRLLGSRGRIEGEATLRELLGDSAYQQAADRAAALDIRLEMLAALEPWYVAVTVLQLELMKHGFDPGQGIESHFTGRAAVDGKPIRGLETLEQQIDVLDRLSAPVQRNFLLMSLEDAAQLESQLGVLISAWREGHTDRLAAELQRGFKPFPELYERMIVARNRSWTETIAGLIDQPQNYLIIVGALHLVGEDGVVELLARRGIRTRQMSSVAPEQ